MKKVQYKTRTGAMQWRPVFNEHFEAVCLESQTGFCLACGHTMDGVEPDARKYACEHCQAPKVYGLEELVVMGLAS